MSESVNGGIQFSSLFGPADILCQSDIAGREDLLRKLLRALAYTHGIGNVEAAFDAVMIGADAQLYDSDNEPIAWPVALAADKGYRADWIDGYLLALGITPVIPSKTNEDRNARPVAFDIGRQQAFLPLCSFQPATAILIVVAASAGAVICPETLVLTVKF